MYTLSVLFSALSPSPCEKSTWKKLQLHLIYKSLYVTGFFCQIQCLHRLMYLLKLQRICLQWKKALILWEIIKLVAVCIRTCHCGPDEMTQWWQLKWPSSHNRACWWLPPSLSSLWCLSGRRLKYSLVSVDKNTGLTGGEWHQVVFQKVTLNGYQEVSINLYPQWETYWSPLSFLSAQWKRTRKKSDSKALPRFRSSSRRPRITPLVLPLVCETDLNTVCVEIKSDVLKTHCALEHIRASHLCSFNYLSLKIRYLIIQFQLHSCPVILGLVMGKCASNQAKVIASVWESCLET